MKNNVGVHDEDGGRGGTEASILRVADFAVLNPAVDVVP